MFLAPKSPLHLQYAYFVASIVVEFWVEQFGHEGLLKLLADLRDGLPIADALARQSGSIDGIDQAFEAFAKSKGASIAPQLDFELIPKEESWSTWLESHPKSYHALHRKLDQSISKKDSVEALAIAQTLYDAWPSDPTESSALVKQSLIHRERKDIQAERLALQQWIELDPHASAPRKRLIEIERELQTWESVMTACNSLLEIQPMQTSTLEHLAEACEKLGQPQVAISSLQALTHLDPLDPAQLHYRLAVAYHKAGQQSDKARRHCLMALEESPRYAQALELLLRLQSADPNR
jgi:tetratricopeptide (TPR) repeat protein